MVARIPLGVVPTVLGFLQPKRKISETQILHALATAGVIGIEF